MSPPAHRVVYGVLSARSLPYSRICLQSLFRNAIEPVALTLITDGPEDKDKLTGALTAIAPEARHTWRVADKAEADERAEDVYAKYPHLRRFRNGHPCWRKVTDPPLFAKDGEEMIILDPDVYFPNTFTFEPTPPKGLLLMWMMKNCMYPLELVRHAFDQGIAMAEGADIGVSQSAAPFDYEWLEDLIIRLGGDDLPAWSAFIEPLVWAAMAMRIGGGYLDRHAWFCINYPFSKRIRLRLLKADPLAVLRAEPIRDVKCFHASGKAKHWLVDAEKAGLLVGSVPQDKDTPVRPFRPFTRGQFDRKILAMNIARPFGLLAMTKLPE